ncbi:hypothetical protein SASPL_112288 [Salvia splendens]|uniref:Uncharacterized protein n=1 Tax=Salvia splendens TaxID=180675 RepID=A0A8X8Y7X7_SALSN|nr:hypothetical protein SASPL_112288 [Salvia splendens]
MCIASFNATLDLMPQTAQRSSLTNLSVSRPKIRRSPVPLEEPYEFSAKEKRGIQNELEGFVGIRVSTCNSANSVWKISQDDLLLNSRCVLYKSMAEEVSIWGWPLQTAGLLTAEYYSRSFSIINGRVTEWSDGKASYFERRENSSWVQEKWSSSVVQFDPNTWLLEYRQSFLLQNARPVSATLKFLKLRLTRDFGKMYQVFWLRYASFGGRWEFRRRPRRTTLVPT